MSVNKLKEKFSRGQGYKSTAPGTVCTLVNSWSKNSIRVLILFKNY